MPANYKPPFAKNVIRRSLRAVLDRNPSKADIDRVWRYFKSRCAYCGKAIIRSSENAHLDHMDPAGRNHISNRAPACTNCNEKEKLGQLWSAFLKKKARNKHIYERRRNRILAWIKASSARLAKVPKTKARVVERAIRNAITAYDAALNQIRRLR